MPFLSLYVSYFWKELSVLLLLPSADDTSKSMLLQKCLNIFTSAVKLQVYIFMSLMLLITTYCCSVHVFSLHSALLWREGVTREITLSHYIWYELVQLSVATMGQFCHFAAKQDAIQSQCSHPSKEPQKALCAYEGRSHNGKKHC